MISARFGWDTEYRYTGITDNNRYENRCWSSWIFPAKKSYERLQLQVQKFRSDWMSKEGEDSDGDGVLECPLCFGELAVARGGTDSGAACRACRTVCGHVFCAECFELTLSTARTCASHGSCPMCRSAVSVFNTVVLQTGAPLRDPASNRPEEGGTAPAPHPHPPVASAVTRREIDTDTPLDLDLDRRDPLAGGLRRCICGVCIVCASRVCFSVQARMSV